MFGALWLMHLLLSGQELAKRKNKRTNRWQQRNYPLLLSDSIGHLFSHLEAACAFCVRGVQNSGSCAKQTEEKQKTKTNKQNKKQTGKQAISYFTIVLSSYDADLSFDQNTDQRLLFLQVTVADNTNSRNNNTIGEITHDKMIIS